MSEITAKLRELRTSLIATRASSESVTKLPLLVLAAGLGSLSTVPAGAQGFSLPDLAVATYGYDAGGWRVSKHPRMLGDVNGDGRDDIVAFGDAGAYVSLGLANGRYSEPVLASNTFGYNAGGWRVGQHPRLLADVNGDGRADIVGFGNAGAYVALGQSDGRFAGHVLAVNNFGYNAGGWRIGLHPRTLDDVNGDGRDDIVGFGNAGAYVALGQSNGTFGSPQLAVGNFGYIAGGWRVERHPRLTADVNGDGRADVVGFGNAGVYVALGQANGTFASPSLAVANFGYNAGGWRVDRHPRQVADVDGDGRDDVIGFGNAGVYVALGQTNGTFTAPFLAVNNFGYNAGGWRVDQHPRLIADVNSDDRADIVGFGNAGAWVSLGRSDGRFEQPSLGVDNFGYNAGGWRVAQHPRHLGDVNGDGRDDIVGFGNAGTYVSLAGQPLIHDLYVRRFTGSALTNADADRILSDATNFLQTADSPSDVATNLIMRRAQGVDTFTTGGGVVASSAAFSTLSAIPGDVKIINAIQWCGGPGGGIIGCAFTPGSSFVAVRFSATGEGSLWAHEFGHNQGNPHRNGTTLVMNPFITVTAREVNAVESGRYLSPAAAVDPMMVVMNPVEASEASETSADALAMAATREAATPDNMPQATMIQAATEGGTDVMEFVQRFYVGGVPYDEATRFTEEDVPTLISVLNDPEMKPYWANAATVLGIIGGDRAAEALIAFAEDFEGEAVDPETYRAALDAVLSLGYLVNRDGNREAVAYLSEKARAITEPTRRDATAAEGGEPGLVLSAPTMASSAILGLSLAGTPDTRAVLESLAADAASAEESQPAMPSNSEVGALIADALETHETVAQEGLRALYEKQQ